MKEPTLKQVFAAVFYTAALIGGKAAIESSFYLSQAEKRAEELLKEEDEEKE